MRRRIGPGSKVLFIGASLMTDGVKTVILMIPFGGPILNWFFVAPSTYIGFALTFSLFNVGFLERGFARFITSIILGGLPGSTTVSTAITLLGVAYDDKRYNEKEREKVAATVRALSNT